MKNKHLGFKVELHCHLDGSLPFNTVKELINNSDVREDIMKEFPVDENLKKILTVPENCGSLEEYLSCFDLPTRLLQTPEAMQIAGYGLARELRKSGVKYAEVRFAPQLHSVDIYNEGKYAYEREILKGLLLGIRKALKFSNVKVNVILCMMRNLPEKEKGFLANSRTIGLAVEFRGMGVVGLDLAGAEARDATSAFEDQFELAKDFKIPFTIHAGEAGSDEWRLESIERAIYYGARRIGHGVALSKSKELMKIVRDKGIVVECCPQSNLDTKAVVGGIEYHPIKMLLEEGVKVTVNTDNMTVSNTSLDHEYELLRSIGITDKDILVMQRNAIEGAFISKKEKDRMLSRVT